jgi:hypothetical protein
VHICVQRSQGDRRSRPFAPVSLWLQDWPDGQMRLRTRIVTLPVASMDGSGSIITLFTVR